MTVTRSDITFAVGILSRFMHQPREVHWTAALRITMLYKKHKHVHIFGYSDSGYADDKVDRKYTIGYCTFVGENLLIFERNTMFLYSVQRLSIKP